MRFLYNNNNIAISIEKAESERNPQLRRWRFAQHIKLIFNGIVYRSKHRRRSCGFPLPRKKFSLLSIVIIILTFSACHQLEAAVVPQETLLAQAVQDGVIISPDAVVATDMAFETFEAVHTRLSRTINTPMNLYFPLTADLTFERSGGRLSVRDVGFMQFVQEGDVLMSITFDVDALRIEEQQLALRMQEADRRHNSERTRRRSDIESFRNQLSPHMNEFEIEIHALRLEVMEADYRNAIREFNILRREQNRQMTEIREMIAGEDLLAPFDGVVSWASSVRIGTVIEPWMQMVTIYDHHAFQLQTRGSPDMLRFGDIVEVTDSNGTRRRTTVVSDPLTTGPTGGYHEDFILQPVDDIDASHFMQGSLNAHPIVFDVEGIIIPTRAIHTEEQRRFVFIYEDGIIRKRYIQQGQFYGGMTQILDGIEEGQLVVIH